MTLALARKRVGLNGVLQGCGLLHGRGKEGAIVGFRVACLGEGDRGGGQAP